MDLISMFKNTDTIKIENEIVLGDYWISEFVDGTFLVDIAVFSDISERVLRIPFTQRFDSLHAAKEFAMQVISKNEVVKVYEFHKEQLK